MKDLEVWEFVRKRLQRGAPVALLAVLHHEGSSPGRQGFKMAVRITGEMCGSIGGGIMEHKLVELAKNMLAENQAQPVLKHQIHSKLAPENQSGMVSSGHQSVGIYALEISDLPEVEKIVAAFKNRQKGVLQLIEKGLRFFSGLSQPVRYTFSSQNPTVWQYTEVIPEREAVYIVGGGHVALAFSKVLQLIGFEIHLFDDREDAKTFKENQYVDFKTITPYSKLAELIPEGEQSYVVIMTHGYRSDKEALIQLAGRNFKYLGLMGSITKVSQLFCELQEAGFNEEALQKIYSPVGLPINSETPEEIAISVAAQLIQVKNS
jgi:xanthine dehydrogenase accessory factor